MSFGAPQAVKNAQNTQGGITEQANANASNLSNLGTSALNAGSSTLNTGAANTNSGTNFFNTLLNGNQANTAALLAPTLNADRAQSQAQLQSASTLTPRGGGRSGTLFNAAYQPQASIQNLFNTGRTSAATELPQIGLQQQQVGLGQQGVGTNLFSLGNSALNTASGSNSTSLQSATQQQQISNQLVGQMLGAAFGLATTPFGGGSATQGLVGLIPGLGGGPGSGGGGVDPSLIGCWIAEAIYGTNDIRTHSLRAYLNGPYKKTRHGALVMRGYMAIGRQVAWAAKRSKWLRNMLRPLFESALVNCRSSFVEIS